MGPRYSRDYETVVRETGTTVRFRTVTSKVKLRRPYILICRDHNVTAKFSSSQTALRHLSHPTVWCMACRETNLRMLSQVSALILDYRQSLTIRHF